MRKIAKFALPLLILASGIAGFVWLEKTKPPRELITKPEKTWRVATTTITLQTLSPTLRLYGRIESPQTATLRAAVSAEVTEVLALEGKTVKQGELLIRLDDRDLQLAVQQREADVAEMKAAIVSENNLHANNLNALPKEEILLSLAQKAQERVRQLEKQQVGSRAAIDEAQQAVERQTLQLNTRRLEIKNHEARLAQLQARRERAEVLLAQAKLDLSRSRITAASASIIAKVNVAAGDRVRNGDPLLSLYETDWLEARAQIPSQYQDLIFRSVAEKQGLTAQAKLNGQTIQLTFHRLAGEVSPNSGGIEGLFRVTTGQEWLRLGQFIELFVSLPPENKVIALPFEALYANKQVYKIVDGRMTKIEVLRVGERFEQASGANVLLRSSKLQAGDEIVITQLPNAMEGLKVITQ